MTTKNIEQVQEELQYVKPAPQFQVLSYYSVLDGWIKNDNEEQFETDNIEQIIHIKEDLYLVHLSSISEYDCFMFVKAETDMDFSSVTK